jgi:hypothetical protein
MISTGSVAYAKRTKHPEFKDRTVEDVFQEERSSLIELRGHFDAAPGA